MSNTKGQGNDDDKKNKNKETVTMTHYTSKEGLQGIMKSGVIKESQNTDRRDDAAFGSGVYLTSMSPDKGKRAIAENNYDASKAFVQKQLDSGKVDYGIRVELPAKAVEKVNVEGRDVHRHQGHVSLASHKHSIIKVKEESSNITK